MLNKKSRDIVKKNCDNCTVGWTDCLEKRANCYTGRTPVPKFHFEMLLFSFAQGLLTVQLGKQFFVNAFGACDRGECTL